MRPADGAAMDHHSSREPFRQGLPFDWTMLGVVPISLALPVIADASQLPWVRLARSFNVAAEAPLTGALLLQEFPTQLPFLVSSQLLAALAMGLLRDGSSRMRLLVAFLPPAVWSSILYLTLIEYERFRGYTPFQLLAAAFVVVWGLASFPSDTPGRRRIVACAGAMSGLIALGACYAHTRYYLGYYRSLHLTLLGVAAASAQACVAAFLVGPPGPTIRRRRRYVLWIACAIGAAALLLPLVRDCPAPLRPYVRSFTTLGSSSSRRFSLDAAVRPETTLPLPACASLRTPLPPDRAQEVFATNSALPRLPADFELRRHNVLLVVVEATRADEVSPATTPNFLGIREAGGFHFTGARSPATSTLQTLSSLLALRLPIDTPLSLEDENWRGRLGDGVETAAEAAVRSGYRTFHAMHGGVKQAGGDSLSRGFQQQHFEGIQALASEGLKRTVDTRLTDKAIQLIDEAAGRHFFGLVFYVSPHMPYLARMPGSWSARERYRQEIQNADKEFGRLWEHLKSQGRLEDTVVIATSDHGEQFGDHGGDNHGNSVFAELKRVPLFVWIPGLAGHAIDAPMSTGYVLPWLFLKGPEPMRQLAIRQVASSLAPVMLLTQGATPVDLRWGHGELGRVSLDYPNASIHYDYKSGLRMLFDTREDPTESNDLYGNGDANQARLDSLLTEYVKYRRCNPE